MSNFQGEFLIQERYVWRASGHQDYCGGCTGDIPTLFLSTASSMHSHKAAGSEKQHGDDFRGAGRRTQMAKALLVRRSCAKGREDPEATHFSLAFALDWSSTIHCC